jgi:putative acetyltransferase
LRAPGRSFGEKGGAFWVAEDERGQVCGCIAIDYPADGAGELHRLYVRPDQRRRGLGYARAEDTRDLGDISNSVEYRFEKRL